MKGLASALVVCSLLVLLFLVRHEARRNAVPANAVVLASQQGSETTSRPSERSGLGGRLAVTETDLLLGAETESDPDRRAEILSRNADAISDNALPECLDLLANKLSPAATELRQLLLKRWVEIAPFAAAGWAARLPEGSTASSEALALIAVTWANTDLPSAIAWAKALPESAGKANALLNLAYETARIEPLSSMEVAVLVPPSPERDRLLGHSISQWATVDASAALSWANSVPDFELRQRLLAETLVSVAKDNSAFAANLAINSLRSGVNQDRVVVAVVQRWAESSPREAADWVSRFSDLPVASIAVQNLVALWVAQDPVGSADWLKSLPVTPMRTAGWNAYAQFLPRSPNSNEPASGPTSADGAPTIQNP